MARYKVIKDGVNCTCGSTKRPTIAETAYTTNFSQRVVTRAFCSDCGKVMVINKNGLPIEEFNKIFPEGV